MDLKAKSQWGMKLQTRTKGGHHENRTKEDYIFLSEIKHHESVGKGQT